MGAGPQGRGNIKWAAGCAAEALPAAETAEAEQGQTQRPRPADETGSCVWRSAPIFTRAFMPAEKIG